MRNHPTGSRWRPGLAGLLALVLVLYPLPAFSGELELRVPEGTRVYVETEVEVIGKKKLTREGDVVPAHVWRDVIVDGQIVVEAGTPVVVRVDELKKAKIAGRRGQLTLGAYETTTVAGEELQLTGGYNKKGKGRIALSATLAAVVLLPLIFIKGKTAKLPPGTVFDAYTGLEHRVTLAGDAGSAPSIDLGEVLSSLRVEVLYDELEKTEKPKDFTFLIYAPQTVSSFEIDTINGQPTEPIELRILSREELAEESKILAAVDIKRLAKRFTRGINRFDVACLVDGERTATEVVLEIQF